MFRPRSAQEWWNLISAVSTVFIALFTWQLARSDAAYLSVGLTEFDQVNGTIKLPLENNGRRPSGEATFSVYLGSKQDGPLSDAYSSRGLMPGLAPGKAPYFIWYNVPNWSNEKLERLRRGVETMIIAGRLDYYDGASIALSSNYDWCQRTISIKKGTDLTWAPCTEPKQEFTEFRALTTKPLWPSEIYPPQPKPK